MLVCIECGHVFHEDDIATWEETHGLDYGPYEEWSGCPECNGSYVEARQCDCCEDWISGPYIRTEDDMRYCENCYRVMDLGEEDC